MQLCPVRRSSFIITQIFGVNPSDEIRIIFVKALLDIFSKETSNKKTLVFSLTIITSTQVQVGKYMIVSVFY